MNNESAIQITELRSATSIEKLIDVCYTLFDYQRKGQNVYYVIEGIKIYSHEIKLATDIERMFIKVYGCTQDEKLKQTAKERKAEWLKVGFTKLPEDKHSKWVEYVDYICENIVHYVYGNPITDAINVIETINQTEDREALKGIVNDITGSDKTLYKVAVQLSNKGALVEELFKEILNPPGGPKF